MLDLVIRDGTVVDGTGSRRRHADVGIRDGRIVAVGQVEESARRTYALRRPGLPGSLLGVAEAPDFVGLDAANIEVREDPIHVLSLPVRDRRKPGEIEWATVCEQITARLAPRGRTRLTGSDTNDRKGGL
jgi:hypothetical protein